MRLKRIKFLQSYFRSAALLAALVFLFSAGQGLATGGENLEYNRRATATAQILAGITPNPPDPALKRFVEADAFKEHQQWMTSSWNQVRNRIQTMEAWRTHEIKIASAQKKTLIYPFSGPDFLNAYAFFPDHGRYVFFSLERPGTLPDLESVTLVQFTKLLQDVRSAFRDIFERNYFITSYMTKQLTTPWIRGTVPVMATMMALMNRRLNPQFETVFMMPAEQYTYISSRLIKEVFSLGGPVTGLVPSSVETWMRRKQESHV